MQFGAMRNTVSAPRSGATLTEVLMALLIMSVGIVSVVTLFPISILSSIRATQLTNARILERNVVETVRTLPDLLVPPSGSQWGPNENGNWKGTWAPHTQYDIDDYVVPARKSGSRWPSPGILLRCDRAGRSGATEPNWYSGAPFAEGLSSPQLRWQMINLSASTRGNYVIDPLGYYVDDDPPRVRFGNRLGSQLPQSTQRLRRSNVNGDIANFFQAQQFFALADSWSVALDVMPQQVSGTTVTLPSSVSITTNDFNISQTRVVLTNPAGTSSVVRQLATGTGGTTLQLSEAVPAGLNMTGLLRIETFTPRYTYLLAVNHSNPHRSPRVSCAIIFNRNYNLDNEHIYNANFGNSNYSDESSVAETSLLPDQVKIAWNPASQPEPLLRENNFLFDARQAVFYRITSVRRTAGAAILTVNRPVEFMTGNTGNSDDVGWAILMPGIVNVYEL